MGKNNPEIIQKSIGSPNVGEYAFGRKKERRGKGFKGRGEGGGVFGGRVQPGGGWFRRQGKNKKTRKQQQQKPRRGKFQTWERCERGMAQENSGGGRKKKGEFGTQGGGMGLFCVLPQKGRGEKGTKGE